MLSQGGISPPRLGRFFTPAPEVQVVDSQPGVGPSESLPEAPPASPPVRRALPSQIPDTARSDPENPRLQPIVRQWIATFLTRGRIGLAEAWYSYAQVKWNETDRLRMTEKANAKASWAILLEDKKNRTNHVLHLLHTLPDAIILALLRGALALKVLEDKDVRSIVSRAMSITADPCVYMNLLCGKDGRFLSSDDVQKLLQRMERYLVQDARPRQDQIDIDNSFRTWRPEPAKPQLRWLQSERAEPVIRQWIEVARETYCKNPTDSTTAFRMVPSEVGWATSGVARTDAHRRNDTTYLFGLIQSILHLHPAKGGYGFPTVSQYTLFRIWERNENLCKVSEIVGSLLAVSYWFLGGLNIYYPGTIKFTKDSLLGLAVKKRAVPPASDAQTWLYNTQACWSRLSDQDPDPMPEQTAHEWADKFFTAVGLGDREAERKRVEGEIAKAERACDARRGQDQELQDEIATLEERKAAAVSRQRAAQGSKRENLVNSAMETLSLASNWVSASNEAQQKWMDELRKGLPRP